MQETIEAVFAAIEATPKYTLQDGRLVYPNLPKPKDETWDEVREE